MTGRKILYICYEDISGYNGAIRHIMEIVRGLSRRGHHVDLCVPKLTGKSFKLNLESDIGIRFIPTICLPVIRPISYIFLSLMFLPLFFIMLRPDVVYIRDIKFTVLPVLLSRIYGIPCILEVNGLLDEELKVRKVAPWIFKILVGFHRWNLIKADHIITVTKSIKSEIICQCGVDGKKISIITNGVDLESFRPENPVAARQRRGLSESYQYIGFVGGFFPWHGLDQLIEAVPYILERRPRVRFVIVGSGPMESAFKKMISKRKLTRAFVLTGSVPFDTVSDYISSFDVCLVFFKRVRKDPGDPIKLYEYLACGKPVVASNVPGYGDVVESVQAGISVNSEDPVAITEAILKLLSDGGLRKKMGENGYAKARKCYGWENKVRETEVVIKRVLKNSNV